MKSKIFVAIISFTIYSSSLIGQSKNSSDNINGKSFSIDITRVSGKRTGWEWTNDVISFSGNKMTSAIMSQHEHFQQGEIFISRYPDGRVQFKSVAENPGGSKLEWLGIIKDKKIEGKVDWHNAQGTQSYKFSGTSK